jgi:hypothetical protein
MASSPNSRHEIPKNSLRLCGESPSSSGWAAKKAEGAEKILVKIEETRG